MVSVLVLHEDQDSVDSQIDQHWLLWFCHPLTAALAPETRLNIGNRQERPIRVFIVDDSTIVQERLAMLLGELAGIEIVGQAGTALNAIAGIQSYKPDVVILDLRMPGNNGLTVLKTIKQGPVIPVIIVLTNHAFPVYRRQCRQAGADYFLDKSTEFDQIPDVLAGLR